jgi:hypothetical protein
VDRELADAVFAAGTGIDAHQTAVDAAPVAHPPIGGTSESEPESLVVEITGFSTSSSRPPSVGG